jgi:hypothetical protein
VCGQNVVYVDVRHMVDIMTVVLGVKHSEIKFGVRTA